MRAFTTKVKILATDHASKAFDRATRSSMKMAKVISKQAKVAMVSLNNLNASVNRVGRSIKKSLGNFGVGVGLFTLAMIAGNIIGTFADFEQANVNLASVMGKTVAETVLLQKDAKILGATTAKTATEVVGLQEALARLGFEEPDILNMTKSIISGSIAMQGELSATAELTGAMVKSFKDFESIDTPEIIDQMTLATQKSALNFEKLQTGLPIVAGAANAAGIPFTRLLALMGKLSDAGIDTSSSATALRNIFIESSAQGLNYSQILKKIEGSQNKLTAANDEFGKRGAVSANILAANLAQIGELDKTLQAAGGTAEGTASKQLDTLRGSITLLGSAWEGLITNAEDGTGAFGSFLKTSVRVVTEILSLASGTEKATSELTKGEQAIRKYATIATVLLKTIGLLIGAFLAYKIIMLAVTIATNIYAAAQWLANAAMLAFPAFWIVAAIVAVVASIYLLINHWDWVKKAVTDFYEAIKNNIIAKSLLAPVIAVVEAIKLLISMGESVYELFGGELKMKAPKEIKNPQVMVDYLNDPLGMGNVDANFSVVPKQIKTDDKLIAATLENTKTLKESSDATKNQWKGRFSTSILKDANLGGGTVAGALANSVMSREITNSVIQKEVLTKSTENSGTLPTGIVTQANSQQKGRNSSGGGRSGGNSNGTVTIRVIDETGGNFKLDVAGSGVEVITTGNND